VIKVTWTIENCPTAFRSLRSEVRDKAIVIANALLEEEVYPKERAIPKAIFRAKEWEKSLGNSLEK
jgi:uncharacterized protein YdaT